MSVQSDIWIIHQCTKPTHQIHDRSGMPVGLISPPYNSQELDLINNWCAEWKRDFYGNKPYASPLKVDAIPEWKPMIEPFVSHAVRYVSNLTNLPIDPNETKGDEPYRRIISYGVSSYGYDVRLKADQDKIKVFTNVFASEIDPKRVKEENFATPDIRVDEEGSKYVMIPPHSYIQAPTIEYFRIPRDILVIVLGKSTYARSALICNVTPIEPEFEGEVVIEVANCSSSPVRCYLEEGIAQFVFMQGNEPCLTSYKDKGGKYQGQTGLTLAKV